MVKIQRFNINYQEYVGQVFDVDFRLCNSFIEGHVTK